MKTYYGQLSTFLIPEYNPYRDRGDALLRHQWDYLFSMMPDAIQQAMRADNQTYSYYRNRFMSDVNTWAQYAASPEDSILYWINFDYMSNARTRLSGWTASRTETRRFTFLHPDDELRLNKVFQEIDPSFVPVDTSLNPVNVWQWSEWRQGR